MQCPKTKKAKKIEDSSASEPEENSEEPSESQERLLAEEKVRMNRLQSSKQKFIEEINKKESNLKNLTPQERMKLLIEKSEKVANFLLTKHSMQKPGARKEKGSNSKNHIMFAHKERR